MGRGKMHTRSNITVADHAPVTDSSFRESIHPLRFLLALSEIQPIFHFHVILISLVSEKIFKNASLFSGLTNSSLSSSSGVGYSALPSSKMQSKSLPSFHSKTRSLKPMLRLVFFTFCLAFFGHLHSILLSLGLLRSNSFLVLLNILLDHLDQNTAHCLTFDRRQQFEIFMGLRRNVEQKRDGPT